MSYTTGTTHYNLPQTVGSDKRDWTDTNEAFSDVDAALWEAHQGATQAALDITSINSEIQTITGKQADDEADIATITGKVSTLETTVGNHTTEIGDVRRDLQDNIESLREDTATSTHAYEIGDYFYYNDVLFKATAQIAIGATIVPNTNCTGVTVMDELKSGGAGESAASVSYDNTGSGLVASNVQTAIDEMNQNLTDKVAQHSDSTYQVVKGLGYDSTNKKLGLVISQGGADSVVPFSGGYPFLCFTGSNGPLYYLAALNTDGTFIHNNNLEGVSTFTDCDFADISISGTTAGTTTVTIKKAGTYSWMGKPPVSKNVGDTFTETNSTFGYELVKTE